MVVIAEGAAAKPGTIAGEAESWWDAALPSDLS
jgi:hypothetical protein